MIAIFFRFNDKYIFKIDFNGYFEFPIYNKIVRLRGKWQDVQHTIRAYIKCLSSQETDQMLHQSEGGCDEEHCINPGVFMEYIAGAR